MKGHESQQDCKETWVLIMEWGHRTVFGEWRVMVQGELGKRMCRR